jgi:hypothetical protein
MIEVKIILKNSKQVVGTIKFISKDILRNYFKFNNNEKFIYIIEVNGKNIKVG